jgi:hypothetical protein
MKNTVLNLHQILISKTSFARIYLSSFHLTFLELAADHLAELVFRRKNPIGSFLCQDPAKVCPVSFSQVKNLLLFIQLIRIAAVL